MPWISGVWVSALRAVSSGEHPTRLALSTALLPHAPISCLSCLKGPRRYEFHREAPRSLNATRASSANGRGGGVVGSSSAPLSLSPPLLL